MRSCTLPLISIFLVLGMIFLYKMYPKFWPLPWCNLRCSIGTIILDLIFSWNNSKKCDKKFKHSWGSTIFFKDYLYLTDKIMMGWGPCILMTFAYQDIQGMKCWHLITARIYCIWVCLLDWVKERVIAFTSIHIM